MGCRKLEYLKDSIDAMTIQLSDEEVDQISRASKFEPGFPISFAFTHFDKDKDYHPSMTTKDIELAQMGGPIDIVAKAKAISLHGKEEFVEE